MCTCCLCPHRAPQKRRGRSSGVWFQEGKRGGGSFYCVPLCAFGILCHVHEFPIHTNKEQFQWVEAHSQATGVCWTKVEKHGLWSQSAGFHPSAKRLVRNRREAVVDQGACHQRPLAGSLHLSEPQFLVPGNGNTNTSLEAAPEGWA